MWTAEDKVADVFTDSVFAKQLCKSCVVGLFVWVTWLLFPAV